MQELRGFFLRSETLSKIQTHNLSPKHQSYLFQKIQIGSFLLRPPRSVSAFNEVLVFWGQFGYFSRIGSGLKWSDGWVCGNCEKEGWHDLNRKKQKKKRKGGRKAIRQQYQLDGDAATSTGQSLISTSEHHQYQGGRSIRRPISPPLNT